MAIEEVNNDVSANVRKAQRRKRNRYEEKRESKIDIARRNHLYCKLAGEVRDGIESELNGAICAFDDKVLACLHNGEENTKELLRNFLRKGIKCTIILAAIEGGNVLSNVSTGRGGVTLDFANLLLEVIDEDEFAGSKQPTPEAQEKMWELTKTYVNDDDVEGMDESQYDIPPPYEETLKAE
jgi:hypothetical protein